MIMANWIYLLWIRPQREVLIPYPPLWWLALGLGFLVLFQVIPWPRGFVSWLAPAAISIRALGNGYALADFIPLSLNPYATILESLKQWSAVGLFFVLIFVLKTRRQINNLIYLILATALFEVVYGFWTFHEHVIWGWKNPYNPDRLCGTFINPDHLATYLTMVILVGFGLFLGQRDKIAHPTHGGTSGRFGKRWSWPEHTEPQFRGVLLLFLLVVLTTGLIFTGSRGGMISLSLGFGVMALLIWSQKRRKAHVYLIVAFVGVALIYSLILGGNRPLARFLNLDMDRYYIFQSAWDQFREFPWSGAGVASFGDLAYRYQTPEVNKLRWIYAHNDWLQGLAETGMVGFALVAGSCGYFFLTLWRQWRSRRDIWARGVGLGGLTALGVAGFHVLVDFSFHIPAVALLCSSLAAITYVSLYNQKRMWESFSYPTINLAQKRLVTTGFIIALILTQLYLGWQVGAHWLAEAAASTEPNSTVAVPRLAPRDYQNALVYNPRNGRLFVGLAVALTAPPAPGGLNGEVVANFSVVEVEELLKAAIIRAPGFWAYHQDLAEFYFEHYDADPSRYLPQMFEELDAAIKLFPSSGYLNLRLGTILSWAENSHPGLVPLKFRGQSADYLKKAIELDGNLKKLALPYLPPR
jgi:O-antigen ligase